MDVSVITPTLGREGLGRLLERLAAQRTDLAYEIVLVPQAPLDPGLPRAENVRVVPAPPGRGYAHVRNVGLEAARGDILSFVDDDALPDLDWLERITAPIRTGRASVASADLHVSLGHGALADAISLLGFPGGAAAGWRTMWPVDSDGTTPHLCTGNCAIARSALDEVGPFDEGLFDGSEDVDLGDRLVAAGHVIAYAEDAKVEHEPRTGLGRFFTWNLRRGRSAHDLSRRRRVGGHVGGRLRSSLRILRRAMRTRLGPTVLGIMAVQYAAQILGYLQGRVGHRPGRGRVEPEPEPEFRPLVTVVVPTLDRERDLARCLDGLARQTYEPFEIVVVDNGCTDGTVALVAERARLDARVRLVHEKTPGLSHARNRGIREARGEIVAYLDDDAVPPPGWLSALVSPFARPEVGGCGGPARPLWERRPHHLVLASRRARSYLGEYDRGDRARAVDWLIGANCAYRREAIEEVGPFRTDAGRVGGSLRSGEDVEFALRIGERRTIRYEPDAWVDHGVSATKLSWRYLFRVAFAIGRSRGDDGRRPTAAAFALPSILDVALSVVAMAGYLSAGRESTTTPTR